MFASYSGFTDRLAGIRRRRLFPLPTGSFIGVKRSDRDAVERSSLKAFQPSRNDFHMTVAVSGHRLRNSSAALSGSGTSLRETIA